MTPDELTLKLSEAKDAFPPINGEPSHEDLVSMREVLTPILLQSSYDITEGKHNLWGIIPPPATYLAKFGEAFPIPTRKGAYPPMPVAVAGKESKVSRGEEATWKAGLVDFSIYQAGIRETSAFILSVVDEVFYKELKDPITFYTDILPSTLLDHLELNCLGLHAIDAVDLPIVIQGYYADASSIPVYINMLEEAQRKSTSTPLPLSDATLLATATKAVMASQEYPDDTREWERLPPLNRTWPNWKTKYTTAHNLRRLQHKATDGNAAPGAANAASRAPNVAPRMGSGAAIAQPLMTPPDFEKLDDYFDNIAAAATNKKTVLADLVATITKLTDANKILTSTNAKLTTQLSTRIQPAGTPSNPSTPWVDRHANCNKTNPGRFLVGGYCWTHGWRVTPEHNSRTCNRKKEGHGKAQEASTRTNLMGGSVANKGWDD